MSSEAGVLLVLAGPSGAGKTTLARKLVEERPGFEFSVSTTTRAPRGDEKNGADYFFVSEDRFDELVADGFFLEWACVHGHRYGTSREWVQSMLASGQSVVLDIDVRGARNVRAVIPGAVLVFVLPPSRDILEERLQERGTEDRTGLAGRMEAASLEIRWAGSFDYLIINSSLSLASAKLLSIVDAERLRISGMTYPRLPGSGETSLFGAGGFWKGRRILVAAGPTREYIDDVRYISNRSSGVMGCELASSFRSAGASVTLLLGPCRAVPPRAVELIRFTDSRQLGSLLREKSPSFDLVAMPVAVADFRPVSRAKGKIPRDGGGLLLELETVEDIAASISGSCPVLAFSLEFGDPGGALERAAGKMASKGAVAVFCNLGDEAGSGMDSEANAGVLLHRGGGRLAVPTGSKRFVCEALVTGLGRFMQADGGM